MRPLSVITYLVRNKARLAPIFGVLVLAVFGISITGVMTGSIIDANLQRVQVYRDAAQISPSFRNGHNTLDSTVEGQLRRDPYVDALYPDIRLSTYFPYLAGDTSALIYAVDEPVYPILLDRLHLTLVAGRLPGSDAGEVALHEAVARSRGLWVGDALDPEQDQQEWLAGKLQIVGILRGPNALSLASRDYISRRTEFHGYAAGLLALPRPETQAAFESDLNALDPNIVRAFTYSAELLRYNRDFSTMDSIVWAINSVVVVVLSLLVGLLNMIYFLDRMNEFGLLLGIGYSRPFVIRRALLESLALTVLAWGFGVLFSQLVYTALNRFYFEPHGMSLSLLNWHSLQFTLPIPVIVSLFAGGTVIWQLRQLDPLSIIEKRD
ncbi:MAG: ABC transporter permease [Anaerolineae bacterium]